jgi:outer membrane protein OmpA-like peptidoglycan-associated protein
MAPPVADRLLTAISSSSWSSSSESRPQTVNAVHRWSQGDDTPRAEWFMGYSFWRSLSTVNNNRMVYLNGGDTNVAYNLNRWAGLVTDFADYGNSRVTLVSSSGNRTVSSNGSVLTYAFGPRFSYRRYERVTPYFQVLFGVAYGSAVSITGCTGTVNCTPLHSDNSYAELIGGGIDVKLNHRIAIRVLEADWLLTNFRDPFLGNGQFREFQNNIRLSSGIVLRFGGRGEPGPPLKEPMAAICSADPEMVYAGSGDFVVVRAIVSNADSNPVTYTWSASTGSVDGTGPEVRWSSADYVPGVYTITAHLDNGSNGATACSTNVRVQERPHRPPTMSCSVDRNVVTIGDTVVITAAASDPDNDPLTFSWTASGGRIDGTGSSVRFLTDGVAPGSYTIAGHVDNGHTGTADCTLGVTVQAPQPPPEQVELESRLALHSIYFATARPTEANPDGGLLDSQQNVLLALAADFTRYLTFKPDANLILEGHADQRGSVEYNNALTQRRVDRAKSFLVAHGVPAANIETKAFGKQENLTADQVKQLVDQNPDLTPEERQRIDANLPVIVLANNRRVDITLSTTGQQSVRQYPFNAKDSLTLLSTSGGTHLAPAKPPARKKAPNP